MSNCNECGTCCKSIVVALNMRTDRDQFELLRMKANYVRHVMHSGRMWVLLSGQCIHLKDNKCDIYATRPQVCKDFPKKCVGVWKKLFLECGCCG